MQSYALDLLFAALAYTKAAFVPRTIGRFDTRSRRAAGFAISMDDSARIEFTQGTPELTVPTVSYIPTRNLTVATFTFANAMSYPRDVVGFGMFANEDFLLQIDLENVGTREQIEQLPTLHAVCEAAGIELRIYATSADSRAEHATHVVTPAGEDSVDAQIIWDASRHVCMSRAADRWPWVLVVTRDHFGRVLASLGKPEGPSKYYGGLGGSLLELAPSCGLDSIDWKANLPLRWSSVLRAEKLSALLSRRTMHFEIVDGSASSSTVKIPTGMGWMYLKDEEGTLIVPAFPEAGSSADDAELSVKSVLVATGSDEVHRFMSFMRRYEACSGVRPTRPSVDEGTWRIFECLRGE